MLIIPSIPSVVLIFMNKKADEKFSPFDLPGVMIPLAAGWFFATQARQSRADRLFSLFDTPPLFKSSPTVNCL